MAETALFADFNMEVFCTLDNFAAVGTFLNIERKTGGPFGFIFRPYACGSKPERLRYILFWDGHPTKLFFLWLLLGLLGTGRSALAAI